MPIYIVFDVITRCIGHFHGSRIELRFKQGVRHKPFTNQANVLFADVSFYNPAERRVIPYDRFLPLSFCGAIFRLVYIFVMLF